jgi:hypothetical protein
MLRLSWFSGNIPAVSPHLTQDPYFGIFSLMPTRDGRQQLKRHPEAPGSLPDPKTGRALKIATVELSSASICPSCEGRSQGGFISFVADARMVYACPECQKLVWLASV